MRALVLTLYAKLMKARAERDFEAAQLKSMQADRDKWRLLHTVRHPAGGREEAGAQ